MSFEFGQPTNGIVQMAYVVPNLQEAIEWWVSKLNVGPWFSRSHFIGGNQTYRGLATHSDIGIAVTCAGHMQIELVQPNDELPSAFREVITNRGYGFHHFGRLSKDVASTIEQMEKDGYALVQSHDLPSGGKIALMEQSPNAPGLIELIPETPEIYDIFNFICRAAAEWTGEDPVRNLD